MIETAVMSAPASPAPFSSLAVMRDRHTQLLRSLPEGEWTDAQWAEVIQFVRRAVATGTFLDDIGDRKAAQGLINYWKAAAFTQRKPGTERAPETQNGVLAEFMQLQTVLEPFEKRALEGLAAKAELSLKDLEDRNPEARAASRQILLNLVDLPEKQTAFAPVDLTAEELLPADRSDQRATVLRALVDAGTVEEVPASEGTQPRFRLRHETLTRHWHRLTTLLNQRLNFRQAAYIWDNQEREKNTLIGGNFLKEVRLYRDRDRVEEEFFQASEREERRKRVWLISIMVCGALLAIGTALGWGFYLYTAKIESDRAGKRKEAAEEAAVARTEWNNSSYYAALERVLKAIKEREDNKMSGEEDIKGTPPYDVLVELLTKAGGRPLERHDGPAVNVSVLTKDSVDQERLDAAISSGSDGFIKLTDLKNTQSRPSVVKLAPVPILDIAIAQAQNGQELRVAGACPNGIVYLGIAKQHASGTPWEIHDIKPFRGDGAAFVTTKFIGNGKWICAGSTDSKAWLWKPSVGTGEPGMRLEKHKGLVSHIEEATVTVGKEKEPIHVLATGSADGTVCIWDLNTSKGGTFPLRCQLVYGTKDEPSKAPIVAIGFNRRKDKLSTWLVTVNARGNAFVWNLTNILIRHAEIDKTVYSGSDDDATPLFNEVNRDMQNTSLAVKPISDDEALVLIAKINSKEPKGQIVASLVRTSTLRELPKKRRIYQQSKSIQFDKSRKTKGAKVEIRKGIHETGAILGLAVEKVPGHNGKWIVASANGDDTVQLWELEKEQLQLKDLARIRFPSLCRTVALKGDNHNLVMVTGCNDGDVRVFALDDLKSFQELVREFQLHESMDKRKDHWVKQPLPKLLEATKRAENWMNLKLNP